MGGISGWAGVPGDIQAAEDLGTIEHHPKKNPRQENAEGILGTESSRLSSPCPSPLSCARDRYLAQAAGYAGGLRRRTGGHYA